MLMQTETNKANAFNKQLAGNGELTVSTPLA